MKTCPKCKESKPLSDFSRCKKASDGLQYRCKECVKEYMRARHEARRDELNAKQAARRAARTPEDRAAYAAYMRAYYEAHSEKWAKIDPAKYAAKIEQNWRRNQDPEVRAAKNAADRARYEADPERYKAAAERRRERKRAATVGEFTRRDWDAIVRRQDGCCHYCGNRAELTEDHLIPLCRGGAHSIGNVVAACDSCNRQKGRKTRMEYVVWLRRVAA